MLKQEELRILEQIEKLIAEAGEDSYIRMTFAGVPEICRRNIENDFGDIPVRDLEELRERKDAELRMKDAECGAKLLKLEHENQALQTHLDEAQEKLKLAEKQAEEWENSSHAAGDLYCELEAECKLKDECIAENEKRIAEHDAEIIRLKAKLFDYMEKEREQNGKA